MKSYKTLIYHVTLLDRSYFAAPLLLLLFCPILFSLARTRKHFVQRTRTCNMAIFFSRTLVCSAPSHWPCIVDRIFFSAEITKLIPPPVRQMNFCETGQISKTIDHFAQQPHAHTHERQADSERRHTRHSNQYYTNIHVRIHYEYMCIVVWPELKRKNELQMCVRLCSVVSQPTPYTHNETQRTRTAQCSYTASQWTSSAHDSLEIKLAKNERANKIRNQKKKKNRVRGNTHSEHTNIRTHECNQQPATKSYNHRNNKFL